MPDSDLRRCVHSVLALRQDLDAVSIAEALWLAAATPAPGTASRSALADASGTASQQDRADGGDDWQRPAATQRATRARGYDREGAQEPDASAGPAGKTLVPGRRVRVQQAQALPRPLDLSRSLRPFKRRWRHGRRLRLDIDATVRTYARTWHLVPEFRPAPERWFEVDLVIDDSPAMTVWDEVVSGLAALLHQLGGFRTVRTWRMSLGGASPVLRNEGGQPWGIDQLRAPGGRRLIIVVSDGSAPGWFRPEVWQMLRSWAGSTPTALISPLATRLWRRTGLNLPAVRVGPAAPGSPNGLLRYTLPYLLRRGDATDEEWLPLPVATFSPHMLGRWARMLMRGDPRGCDALLIPPTGLPDLGEDAEESDPPVSGRQLVEVFRRTASPEASRLAVLCAPFTRVSLPLLQLVSHELVSGASTADVAEVIVGGLFRPVSFSPGGAVFRFHREVQARLRELLPEADAWHTYEVLTRHITARAGLSGTFRAAIPDPDGDVALPSDLRPFAAASREALEFLDALPADWRDQVVFSAAPPQARTTVPQIWGNVPVRMVNFTGRDHDLARLREAVSRNATVLVPHTLQGLGGVGKTALAVEYAHRYQADYDVVWWIAADDPTAVRSALASLANRLDVESAGEAGVDAAAMAALEALRRGEPSRRWLLIFDNADQPAELTHLIPDGPGAVVITSRNPDWSRLAETVELDVFSRSESTAFLSRRVGTSISAADAERLAEELGDLPLALEQAGAWLHETGMPVGRYLQLLHDSVTQIMAEGQVASYPGAITGVWRTALDTLQERNPQAVVLLHCLAFFGPEPVPRDLFRPNARLATAPLGELLNDPIAVTRAIRDLLRFALVRVDKTTVSVHRLIQAMIRDSLTPADQDSYRHAAHLLLAARAREEPADARSWSRFDELINHVTSPATQLERCTDVSVRDFVLKTMQYLSQQSEFESCRTLAERFIQPWTEDSGPDDPQVLEAQRHLGDALRSLGQFPAARELISGTLERARSVFGHRDERTLALRASYASDLRVRGDFAGARRLDEESGQLYTELYGRDHSATCRVMGSLALDCLLTGDYRAARVVSEQVLHLQQRPAGEWTLDLLTTWNYLAWAARLCGQYGVARDISEEALAYGREIVGPSHYTTLRIANTLSIVLRRTGAHRESVELAQRVVDNSQSLLGDRHTDTLSATVSLANALRSAGEIVAALALTETTLERYAEVLGSDHPYYAACAGNLALLRRGTRDIATARTLSELNQLDTTLGRDHPYSLIVEINLASDLALLGESTSARSLGEDSHSRLRRALGTDHPVTLGCAANLALDLRASGSGQEAERLFTETMARYQQVLGPDHPDTVAAAASRRLDFDIDLPPL